jgi:hypothetical protein
VQDAGTVSVRPGAHVGRASRADVAPALEAASDRGVAKSDVPNCHLKPRDRKRPDACDTESRAMNEIGEAAPVDKRRIVGCRALAGNRIGGATVAGDVFGRPFFDRRALVVGAVGRAGDGTCYGDVPRPRLYRERRSRRRQRQRMETLTRCYRYALLPAAVQRGAIGTVHANYFRGHKSAACSLDISNPS